MNKPTYIYTLVDPITNEVRYVGRSVNPKKRYHRHLSESRYGTRSHKKAWVRSLIQQDQKPILEIIETVPPDLPWQPREQYWIRHYRSKGIKLTNMSDGGDGSLNRASWNKGTRGVMKVNSGSFKPGEHRSPDTEIKPGQRLSPATEFKKGLIPHNIKMVDQCLSDGTIVNTYQSYKEAAKAMNVYQSAISRAVKKGYTCNGYKWRNHND